MKDYYKILGVTKSSTTEDIKKRFRERALLIHPDKSGQNTKEEFIELFEAYEILADRKKRERYDLIYDWIDTPTVEQKDKELTRDILLIHEKGLVYADNFIKFKRSHRIHIIRPVLFQVYACGSRVDNNWILDNWKGTHKA